MHTYTCYTFLSRSAFLDSSRVETIPSPLYFSTPKTRKRYYIVHTYDFMYIGLHSYNVAQELSDFHKKYCLTRQASETDSLSDDSVELQITQEGHLEVTLMYVSI